jgi:hypothetical protein
MRKISIVLLPLLISCAGVRPRAAAPVAFDHLWIVVQTGAPERAVLERAGFRFDPVVSRHDGQGTASVTAEFRNAYLELLWPDPSVPIAPGLERGAEKFRQRMLWRTSGWSPIGINLHYTGSAPQTLPLPVWQITPPWMPAGSAIIMLMPRDDTISPSLSIHSGALPVPEDANEKVLRARDGNTDLLVHPIGVQRVTGVRVIAPASYRPIPAMTYLQEQRVFDVTAGDAWAVELTFDGGAQQRAKDFRPELPLLIRY